MYSRDDADERTMNPIYNNQSTNLNIGGGLGNIGSERENSERDDEER